MAHGEQSPPEGVSRATDGRVVAMTYSHDGFGLGHLRRTTLIATHLVEEVPAATVLMVMGSPSGAIFPLPAGVDFLKLPSVIKVGTGAWEPRTLRVPIRDVNDIRAFTIRKCAELLRPDLFVVDHVATGVYGELLPTLDLLKRRHPAVLLILGLRDILDAPEVTRALWQREGVYETIDRYYDHVFIYGCQEVFDTAAEYGLDGALAEKVTYCGYLAGKGGYRPREQLRQDLRVRAAKLVVVTAGGGYDAFPMMRACVDAFKLTGEAAPFEAIVITGPLMRPAHRDMLRHQVAGLPVRVLSWVEDSLSYMNAADLVVTMAGYNTLMEALRLKKRLLVVPRNGPSAEQRIRARLFARLGLVRTIEPEQLSPSVLAQAIIEGLEDPSIPRMPLRMNGAATVVRQMTRHLRLETAHG